MDLQGGDAGSGRMKVPDELTPLAEGRLRFGDLAMLLAITGGVCAWQGPPVSMGVIAQHKAQATSGGLSGADVGEAQALFFVGWGVGAALILPCVDCWGRKLPCLGLLALGVASTAASAAATTPLLYDLATAFVGCSCNAAVVAGLLLQESVPERLRPMGLAVINVSFCGANLAIALVGASLTRELPWRSEVLLWDVPFAVLLLVALAFLREPPQPGQAGVEAAPEGSSATSALAPVRRILGSPTLCGRVVTTTFTCTASNVAYYVLSYCAGTLSSSLYGNLALAAVVDLLCFSLAGPVISLLGARTAQMASFACAAPTMVACSLLPAGSCRAASALVGRLFLDVAFTTAFMLPVECFPAECRGCAIAVNTAVANVGTLAAPLFSLMEVRTMGLFICALCVSAALATWTLPGCAPARPASELLEHASERTV